MEVFPDFRGITYPIKKVPKFGTIIQATVSGKETRFSNACIPIFQFELSFNYLTQNDFKRILTFYHSVKGMKDSFLFLDKTDYQAIDQIIGIGDGATTTFQLHKNIDGLKYPIKNIISIDNIKIANIPTSYSLLRNSMISFTNPPAKDAIITASFSYYYNVRFSETNEYEKFAYDLWNLKSLKIETAK